MELEARHVLNDRADALVLRDAEYADVQNLVAAHLVVPLDLAAGNQRRRHEVAEIGERAELRAGQPAARIVGEHRILVEQLRKTAVAFDDLHVAVDDHDAGRNIADQRVALLLRELPQVRHAHADLGLVGQQRFREIAAAEVAAAAAVQLIRRSEFPDRSEGVLDVLLGHLRIGLRFGDDPFVDRNVDRARKTVRPS